MLEKWIYFIFKGHNYSIYIYLLPIYLNKIYFWTSLAKTIVYNKIATKIKYLCIFICRSYRYINSLQGSYDTAPPRNVFPERKRATHNYIKHTEAKKVGKNWPIPWIPWRNDDSKHHILQNLKSREAKITSVRVNCFEGIWNIILVELLGLITYSDTL